MYVKLLGSKYIRSVVAQRVNKSNMKVIINTTQRWMESHTTTGNPLFDMDTPQSSSLEYSRALLVGESDSTSADEYEKIYIYSDNDEERKILKSIPFVQREKDQIIYFFFMEHTRETWPTTYEIIEHK